jgi:excisionase family DNA binding protein
LISPLPGAIKDCREEILTMAVITLTPEQVAQALQLSLRTVYQYLKEGKIPGKKIGGRRYGQRWRVLEDDLKAFLRGEEGWRDRGTAR